MALTSVRFYMDGWHDPEDPRHADVAVCDGDDGRDVARAIAEAWWHRDGDYSTAFDVVIVAPTQFVGRYPVEVESMPHFVVGKPQLERQPRPDVVRTPKP